MKRLTLFIDADDTILDFSTAETKAITKTFIDFNLMGYKDIVLSYKRNNIKAWKAFELHEIERKDIGTLRFKWTFAEYGIEGIDINEINRIYWDYLEKQGDVLDGAQDFLEHVCKNHNLYIITNGTTSVQNGRFEQSGLDHYFIKRYISEQLGTRKPEKAFFDVIEKELNGIDRNASFVIGDSLSSDIQGGINANIKTIWFNIEGKQNTKDIKPTYEVKSFEELKTLIDKLSEE